QGDRHVPIRGSVDRQGVPRVGAGRAARLARSRRGARRAGSTQPPADGGGVGRTRGGHRVPGHRPRRRVRPVGAASSDRAHAPDPCPPRLPAPANRGRPALWRRYRPGRPAPPVPPRFANCAQATDGWPGSPGVERAAAGPGGVARGGRDRHGGVWPPGGSGAARAERRDWHGRGEGVVTSLEKRSASHGEKRLTFPNPLLVVVSGPSGVGKSTIVADLTRRHPQVVPIVTVTTRPR